MNKLKSIQYNYDDRCVYFCPKGQLRGEPLDRTILIVLREDKHMILNGDHRQDYLDCNSLSECLWYFYANEKLIHPLSDHIKPWPHPDFE